MMRKKIEKHSLITKMKGYERPPQPSIISPKIKAITIIITSLIFLTFGVHYLGTWNLMDIAKPNNGIVGIWGIGLLTLITTTLLSLVLALLLFIMGEIYKSLVKRFE